MEEDGTEQCWAVAARRFQATKPAANTARLDYVCGGMAFSPPDRRVQGARPTPTAEALAVAREVPSAASPTPINAAALAHELDSRGYPNRPLRDYVVSGYQTGYDILLRGDLSALNEHLALQGKNWGSAALNGAALTASIAKDVARNVLMRTTRPVLHSPLATNFKKDGRVRPVVDLSHSPDHPLSVNDFVEKGGRAAPTITVTDILATIGAFKELPLGRSFHALTFDVVSAFSTTPVKAEQAYLLGQYWEGSSYVATSTPFGLCSAPLLFSSRMATFLWLIKHEVARITAGGDFLVTAFVDDILIVIDEMHAPAVYTAVTTLLAKIGVPIDLKKHESARRISYIGFQWDLTTMQLHADPAKQHELLTRINDHLATGSLTRDEARSLAGALQFTLLACGSSRVHLQRLYSAIHSRHGGVAITLSAALRFDLEALVAALELNIGRVLIKNIPQCIIFTDAAMSRASECEVLRGAPAFSGHAGFFALTSQHEGPVYHADFDMPACVTGVAFAEHDAAEVATVVSSTLYELAGAAVALTTLIEQAGVRDQHVLVACDNLAVAETLSKGRALSATCNSALRCLLATAARAGVTVHGVHLRRERRCIQIADALSRSSQDLLREVCGRRPLVALRPDPSKFSLATPTPTPRGAAP